ncbi:type I restriction enzyme HsdR N-terminal domain-containing protein [Rhabdochlamydiaceae symbiont of Dictyostelium giganteum]|uniref:type I restriction enzyme HsdR N-terminal domain-containing protein n=1 Tax=Rhabdochlamydiaceae symbiont of Dictyostelium giganteum TaxID=3342349 RepID=UPI00384DCD3C
MKEIFDPIRKQWVSATPEEIVRQQWLNYMVGTLGFPKELIAIEKELKMLPHLLDEGASLPLRRVDIMSFTQVKGTLKPLLLLECKQVPLTHRALSQVVAYNYYVKAPYVGIVGKEGILLEHIRKSGSYQTFMLPSYEQLIESLN